MPTLSQLPSGKWRAQVRRNGTYSGKSFDIKREASQWAAAEELQVKQSATAGYHSVPKGAKVGDLVEKYQEMSIGESGRTKTATLSMLIREIGDVKLHALSGKTLSAFIDRRIAAGAGGVTIAGDLSFLSAVLKWARHARKLDVPDSLALDARASLEHYGLKTRSKERERKPTDEELLRLFAYWQFHPRQLIDMSMICTFALATGMRRPRCSMNAAASAADCFATVLEQLQDVDALLLGAE